MAFHFQFGVLGEAQIDRTLQSYSEAVEDMRPAWDTLAKRFAKAEERQFKTEGAYGGDRWSPLSPAYAKWKNQHFPGMPIMQREQHLFTQLTKEPFGVDVRELNFALYGTALPYAVIHQEGQGNNPVRKIIAFSSYEKRAWVKVIQEHLHNAAKARVEAQFPLTRFTVRNVK